MQQQRAHFTSISMQEASLPLCIIEVWGQQGHWSGQNGREQSSGHIAVQNAVCTHAVQHSHSVER